MSDRKANRKEIRVRHNTTLLIDWKKEFDPEAQPLSHSNALMCHTDRGNLLDDCDTLEAEVKRLRDEVERLNHVYKLDMDRANAEVEKLRSTDEENRKAR
jgi:hypothetical protein